MRMEEGSVNLFNGQTYYYLDLEDISFEEFVFMVDVKNNELTAPMKKIQALIHNLQRNQYGKHYIILRHNNSGEVWPFLLSHWSPNQLPNYERS